MKRIWAGVRIALIGLTLCFGAYAYSLWRCSAPESHRPIFGDFTIQCEWNRGIRKVDVFDLGSTHEPSNPVTRFLLRRMAKPIALRAMGAGGFVVARGEIQARAYGDLFPCMMDSAGGHFGVRITSPEQKPLPKGVRIAY